MSAESIQLFYKDGSSDKVYCASLEEENGGWMVKFQYGKRGSTLKPGAKTASPVDYAKAKKEYDKLVAEKVGKGYRPEDGTVNTIQNVNLDKVHSGMTPQLLNPVSRQEGNNLLDDCNFLAQEKFDGERRMMRKNADNTVDGTNRKGYIVPMQTGSATDIAALKCKTCQLDGEDMGDKGIVLFDVLEIDGEDLSKLGALERWKRLYTLVSGQKPKEVDGIYAGCNNGSVYVCATAINTIGKERLLEKLQADKKEGIVFKEKESEYVPGRPASGGNQLKWKFVESATCMIGAPHATKRSASLLMLNEKGAWVDVGNVTIPVNKDIPQSQDIVEVEYLYAYEGGSLYQPVYKMPRPDQGPEACVTSQLKYKSEVDLDDNVNLQM